MNKGQFTGLLLITPLVWLVLWVALCWKVQNGGKITTANIISSAIIGTCLVLAIWGVIFLFTGEVTRG